LPDFAERAAAWRRAPRSFRVAVVVLVLAVLGLATASGLGSPSPPGDLTVRFLDIGQGDATLIQHPDGTAVLFDGGPPEGGVARLLRRAGVRRLAIVVATHASRDHHGGLAEVLAHFPVGVLLDGGDGNPDRGLQTVRETAARRGVRIVRALAPMTLHAGGLTIRVLSPPPRPPGSAPEDPNPRAVTAIVNSGAFDLFLSADAESEALLPLDLPDVEAMKVPHHGSSDPGLPEVLERLDPQIAGIEVGVNTYGHPAPSTLAALKHADVTTYRTDRDGTVTLTVNHGRMKVETEH
jgi:competence protein ComEC